MNIYHNIITIVLVFFISISSVLARDACLFVFEKSAQTKTSAAAPTQIRSYQEIKELHIMSYNVENLFVRVGKHEWINSRTMQQKTTKKRQYKSEAEIEWIRKIFFEESPDIIVLQEVESLLALDHLAKDLLSGLYRPLLIQGNDPRGIQIGFLIKTDLPFHITHETHKNKMWNDPVDGTLSPIFSRDLPALVLRKSPGDSPFLIVMGNHAKSKRDRDGDPESKMWRTAQYMAAAEIVRGYQKKYNNVPIMIAGDFNTDVRYGPELNPVRSLLKSAFDVSKIKPVGPITTHTYHPYGGKTQYGQYDDVMSTANLWDSILEAKVYRYKNANNRTMVIPRTYEERERQPSDHFPVQIRLSTETLFRF